MPFKALHRDSIANKKSQMTSNTIQGPVLVTGGCGYIGSHTIICLLEQGYDVVVVDNLVNSSEVSLDRVARIANLDDVARMERLVFHQVDLCDKDALKKVFESSPKFSSCIHFAGLKVRTVFRFLFTVTFFDNSSKYFARVLQGCRRKY
jgi:nucleoside-diphosphate-sugar epimerase